jgi:hypothetical protein
LKRAAFMLAFLPAIASAQAWDVTPLTNGWSLHRRIGGSSAIAAACTSDRAYVLDSSGYVASFQGGAWTALARRSDSHHLRSVAATPDGRAFFGADSAVLEWDGSRWIEHALDRWEAERDAQIAAPSAREVYYVGRGRIAAYDGTRFVTYDGGTWRSLTAVAALGDTVWVGGQGGTILRHGASWTREPTSTEAWVRSIVAFAPDDLWVIAGDELSFASIVLHYDGRAWTRRDWTGDGRIWTVGGTREQVYATNDRAGLLRWDGDRWAVEIAHAELGSDGQYYGVAGVCATDRHVVVGYGPHALVRSR